MPRPRLLASAAALALLFAAGAARAATPGDPFESFNRWSFNGSFHLDQTLFKPVIRIYRALTPGPIGDAIHNFLANVGEPVIIANDILQARVHRAAHDLARFGINSTLGFGGVIDIAVKAGIPFRDNDFGITLGRWGLGPGPYLFLPVIGPSDLRDAVGHGVDTVMSPLTWARFPGRGSMLFSTQILNILDQRERGGPQMEALLSGAADPYATLRSVFLQSREAAIRGEESGPVLPSLDEGASAAPQPDSGDPPLISPPTALAAAGDAAAGVSALAEDAPIATARPCDATGGGETEREGAGA